MEERPKALPKISLTDVDLPHHQEVEISQLTHFLINCGETHQERPNSFLKWRLQSDVLGTSPDVNFEVLYYFYYLLQIVTDLENRTMDVLKTSRKDAHRMTFLGSPVTSNRNSLTNAFLMHSFRSYFTKCVPETLRSFRGNILKTSYKSPKVTSGGWRFQGVPRMSILNISTKWISVLIFSNLVNQMRVLNTKKLVTAYYFDFGETS